MRRTQSSQPEGLRRRAEVIYKKLDSTMSIGKLYKLAGGSYFRFLVEVSVLELKGLIKVLDQGVATPKSTHELPLSNLLLEQAAEEQMSHARRAAIPIDALEHLVPIWANEPDEDTWPSLSDEERDFLTRIDGRQRLGELLSQEGDARRQEAELLIVRLRKGAIALIPRPAAELEAAADERGLPEKARWWRPFWKKS